MWCEDPKNCKHWTSWHRVLHEAKRNKLRREELEKELDTLKKKKTPIRWVLRKIWQFLKDEY